MNASILIIKGKTTFSAVFRLNDSCFSSSYLCNPSIPFISGECLSNPDKCTAGLTFGMRFKLDDAAKNYKDEPHYIVDSGGSSKESRGFTLFVKDSKLYAVVSVPDEVWRVG